MIAVPFYEGSHDCRDLKQAIDVVSWFVGLHEANFVKVLFLCVSIFVGLCSVLFVFCFRYWKVLVGEYFSVCYNKKCNS